MKKKEREYGLGFVQKEKNEREKRETESRSREQQRVRHRKGDREGLEGPPRDGEADRPESPSESLGGPFRRCLVERDLDVTVGNLLLQILRVLAVDGAADGNAGAEDLLDAATELLGHGPRAHDLGDLDDVVESAEN
uniref:Uncharacterized protein n=1 Tax=Fagus sylvatica TaxID=28930 RepID=A0A2N9FR52_FAGSY